MISLTRADKYLVDFGYYDSRAQAAAAIKSGHVRIDGKVLTKTSSSIVEGAHIEASLPHPWVSRGGLKLEHALDVFNVRPVERVCLDVGSSTGGFTDVLLSKGAEKIYAVDVGTDQLHPRLRDHSKVTSMEQTDARTLTADMFEPPYDFIVCDASFISLSKVLEVPLSLAKSGSDLVTLVKPQFEVGRDNIGKGGVVKDNGSAEQAVEHVKAWLVSIGWIVKDETPSPIKGGSGNAEFLLHALKI